MGYQLLITLRDVTPAIWRRVVLPSNATLGDLHNVIQIAMGWEDDHLHEFEIRGQRYGAPDAEDGGEVIDERATILSDIVRARSRFVYVYDFGDNWTHDVVVEKSNAPEPEAGPECVGGARSGPPEDSGGPYGYEAKLLALANPDDPELDEDRDWIGDFDPELFDAERVNARLRQAFTRRRSRRWGRRPR